ncbi:hypothetical protein VTI74DRAFT_3140 [Chaetomium olivicolor]
MPGLIIDSPEPPAPSGFLEPLRLKITIPLQLLSYCDPDFNATLATLAESAIQMVAYIVKMPHTMAEAISEAFFGSTEAVPTPFAVHLRQYPNRPSEVVFTLNHGVEGLGTNPKHIHLRLERPDGRLVLEEKETTEDERRMHNQAYENAVAMMSGEIDRAPLYFDEDGPIFQ